MPSEELTIWVRHQPLGWQKHRVTVLEDGYQDTKTKEKFLFSRGVEVSAKQPDVCPAVYMDASHTCIVVKRTDAHTWFVPMSTLELTKAANGVFDATWQLNDRYPVRRAAQLYCNAGEFRPIPPKTREHLGAIAADPATEYQPFSTQPGETEMAKKETGKAPAAKTGMDTVVKGAKAAAKKAVAEKPAKAERKAPWDKDAKSEPAAKAPAKAAAPAKPEKVKVEAKPAAKTAASRKPAISGDAKHTVKDDSKVKRGFLRDYVDEAKKLGTFTRDKLVQKLASKADEERLVRYFAYCVGNGIFAAAE